MMLFLAFNPIIKLYFVKQDKNGQTNTCDMANMRRSDGKKDSELHSSFEVSDEIM